MPAISIKSKLKLCLSDINKMTNKNFTFFLTSIRRGTGSILISQSLRILKLVLREHFSGRRGRYTLMTGAFGLWVIVGVSDG